MKPVSFAVVVAISIAGTLTCAYADDDVGVCYKEFHTRGIGRFEKNCTKDEEKSGLMCYPKCPAGAVGEGPICLFNCPESYPISDGPICCASKEQCIALLAKDGFRLGIDLGKIIVDHTRPAALAKDIAKLLADARSLALSECKSSTSLS